MEGKRSWRDGAIIKGSWIGPHSRSSQLLQESSIICQSLICFQSHLKQVEHKLTMLLLCQMPLPSLRSRRPYTRLYRNVPLSPVANGRPRRSNSSDSYGIPEKKDTKELTAGQKKAQEDKKGSRHADVIDTWDPTGLGSASEYHCHFRRIS